MQARLQSSPSLHLSSYRRRSAKRRCDAGENGLFCIFSPPSCRACKCAQCRTNCVCGGNSLPRRISDLAFGILIPLFRTSREDDQSINIFPHLIQRAAVLFGARRRLADRICPRRIIRMNDRLSFGMAVQEKYSPFPPPKKHHLSLLCLSTAAAHYIH